VLCKLKYQDFIANDLATERITCLTLKKNTNPSDIGSQRVFLGTYGRHDRAFNGFENVEALVLLGTFRRPTYVALRRATFLAYHHVALLSAPSLPIVYPGVDDDGTTYERSHQGLVIKGDDEANWLHQYQQSADTHQALERCRGVTRAGEGRPAARVFLVGCDPVSHLPIRARLVGISMLLALPAAPSAEPVDHSLADYAERALRACMDSRPGKRPAVTMIISEMRRDGASGAASAVHAAAKNVLTPMPKLSDEQVDAIIDQGHGAGTSLRQIVSDVRAQGHHEADKALRDRIRQRHRLRQ